LGTGLLAAAHPAITQAISGRKRHHYHAVPT
jgi:hypothetical protein